MNTRQRSGSVVSISSARRVITAKRSAARHRPAECEKSLSELVELTWADADLCYIVTEIACMEFGWTWLSPDEAIMLLGQEKLGVILSRPDQHGRSAHQLRQTAAIDNERAVLTQFADWAV